MTVKETTEKSAGKAGKSDEFYPFSHKTIFGHVMKDEEIASEVASIILGRKIEKVINCISEYEIKPAVKSKGVRLDVYFEDDNNIYDIEMQVSSRIELAKRCRYYQGSLDTNMLKSGQKFDELKNSYIIFLCLFDPFNNNQYKQEPIQAINTFEMVRTNDPVCKIEDALKLKTGAKVIICNTLAYEKTSGNLHDLLEYIAIQKVEKDNSFVKKIDNVVQHANKNDEIRSKAMKYDLDIEDAKKDAKTEERQTIHEALIKILEHNKDLLPKQAKEELETFADSLDTTGFAAQH